jgi:hypothetical protein
MVTLTRASAATPGRQRVVILPDKVKLDKVNQVTTEKALYVEPG